jgi:hypothetical protein
MSNQNNNSQPNNGDFNIFNINNNNVGSMFDNQQPVQTNLNNNGDNVPANYNFNDDGIAASMIGKIRIPK